MDSQRRHTHEENKRTKKLRRLLDKLGGVIASSEVTEKESKDVLARASKSLANNSLYQAYKSRN